MKPLKKGNIENIKNIPENGQTLQRKHRNAKLGNTKSRTSTVERRKAGNTLLLAGSPKKVT